MKLNDRLKRVYNEHSVSPEDRKEINNIMGSFSVLWNDRVGDPGLW